MKGLSTGRYSMESCQISLKGTKWEQLTAQMTKENSLLMFKDKNIQNYAMTYFSSWRGSEMSKKEGAKEHSTLQSKSLCVSSLFLPMKFTMLIKARWDTRSVGGVKCPVTFARFLLLLKSEAWISQHTEFDMWVNRALDVWVTPSVCEEGPHCTWNPMRGNKGKGKEKRTKWKK